MKVFLLHLVPNNIHCTIIYGTLIVKWSLVSNSQNKG